MLKQTKTKTSNNEEQKLTPEELKEFREAYDNYQKAIFDLGSINLEIETTKRRLDELNMEKNNQVNHIYALNEKQQELGNKLGDKYGLKQVDLETGELK
jgi:phosphoribosylaminoimidazole-succinocarboxamide synthase